MIPGHEIDRNLPLRKFFTAHATRAVQLSRTDAQMRRILDEFGRETGYDYRDKNFENLSKRVMFKSEVSKEMAYGILELQHFVEFMEYVVVNPEEAKKRSLTEGFADKLEVAFKAIDKLAPYADGIVLETFDFNHEHTMSYGQPDPAH